MIAIKPQDNKGDNIEKSLKETMSNFEKANRFFEETIKNLNASNKHLHNSLNNLKSINQFKSNPTSKKDFKPALSIEEKAKQVENHFEYLMIESNTEFDLIFIENTKK